MRKTCFQLVAGLSALANSAPIFAQIQSDTQYALNLTQAKEISKEVEWSAPEHFAITPDGLGWGDDEEEGSRDFWLQTEPFGIGLSWRPTTSASLKVRVEGVETAANLYARYSADRKHWTTWQPLPSSEELAGVFQGALRVPYRTLEGYQQRRLKYARREDVPWRSDEEAFVKELLQFEPAFFEHTTPFIGYVQFLYESQMKGGQRLTGIDIDVGWMVGGKHQPPKDAGAENGRDGPWRFRAP